MRALANFTLLTRLPPLHPQFFNEPPIKLENLWKRFLDVTPQVAPLIQIILLAKEIAVLEQVYIGKSPIGLVVTPPDVMLKAVQEPKLLEPYWPMEIITSLTPQKWAMEVWKNYLHYALKMAKSYKSCLAKWLLWDWQLRHAFWTRRVESPKSSLLWLHELIPLEITQEHQQIMALYNKESNPLQAELALDRARWQKLSELALSYSFDNDELVVYTLQLMLLERWWNIFQSQEDLFAKVLNG